MRLCWYQNPRSFGLNYVNRDLDARNGGLDQYSDAETEEARDGACNITASLEPCAWFIYTLPS